MVRFFVLFFHVNTTALDSSGQEEAVDKGRAFLCVFFFLHAERHGNNLGVSSSMLLSFL